jgi:hypothetical protein
LTISGSEEDACLRPFVAVKAASHRSTHEWKSEPLCLSSNH